jgi:hypothetical protein
MFMVVECWLMVILHSWHPFLNMCTLVAHAKVRQQSLDMPCWVASVGHIIFFSW